MGIMLRIILGVMLLLVCLIFIRLVVPMWRLMFNADCIFKMFEMAFDVYPEELGIFNKSDTISCGKIRFRYSNAQEACTEFYKCICETLEYYEKYDVIVKQVADLYSNKKRLLEIKERMYWLKKRA